MKMEDTLETSSRRWQDYWAMALRRRGWLMAPLFVGGFVAFGAAHYTQYNLTERSPTFEENEATKEAKQSNGKLVANDPFFPREKSGPGGKRV